MTGRTRDYLADLALKKGVELAGWQDVTQSAASKKIDELAKLPDANFSQVGIKDQEAFFKRIDKTITELMKWTLTE